MASVFSSRDNGVVKVVLTGSPAPIFRINVNGFPFTAPVTGFALDMQGNYQFLHTINEFIYLYTFGDRISDLVLTGVCFTEPCDSAASGSATEVFNFYKTNRIAKRDEPVNVQLGPMGSFKSFLTGAKIEQPKADHGIAQWVMRFHSLIPA